MAATLLMLLKICVVFPTAGSAVRVPEVRMGVVE